jgi:hypothetical protein
LSLALKSGCPATETVVRQRRGSNERRLRVEAVHQCAGETIGRHIGPPDKRAAVLALATANEDAEARERKENAGRLRFMKFDEINSDAPCHRYWNRIMRLKAAVVYTFTRDITNDHSAQDAALILFKQQREVDASGVVIHPTVPGSGYILEYLDGLPGIKVDYKALEKAERAAKDGSASVTTSPQIRSKKLKCHRATGGVRQNARQNGQIRPSNAIRTPGMATAGRT